MQTKTFNVPNISCGHCKMRIEKALRSVSGVSSASAAVATKKVMVEWDDAQTSWDDLRATLEKIGYPPEA
ncbi:heavy metal transport/detoxification protein [Candidatus Vecturithrix granuli]|uniref:Heavy metal transport/detoxification protein n=1 Tax=Vecturithrix granuli TaxID=1499967 RepID=A0A081BZ73_VECG1|nr:heavy metal transport/detoxification protein [Candidatus Vecturithrix granuli]